MILQARDISKATLIINGDTTITPDSDAKFAVISESDITLDPGTVAGITLSFITQDSCTVTYTDINGNPKTDSFEEGSYFVYNYEGSYWVGQGATAVTGVDDNGQPFAFNVQSLVNPSGVINLTGTDADGNPFDCGLGRLVTNADEDNLVTGVEVKTSKTFNGKPVYVKTNDFELSITGGSTTEAAITESYSTPHLGKIVTFNCVMINGSYQYPMPWVRQGRFLAVNYITGSAITFQYLNFPTTTTLTVRITIWYTKTTD